MADASCQVNSKAFLYFEGFKVHTPLHTHTNSAVWKLLTIRESIIQNSKRLVCFVPSYAYENGPRNVCVMVVNMHDV